MKSLAHLLATVAALAGLSLCLPPDMPAPVPYEPTSNPAQRVREFIRGDRNTLDEADLYSPNTPPELRRAALNLAD
jgi:hypothetical protein